MKIFVAFFIIIASVTASEQPSEWKAKQGNDLKSIPNDCINESKLTEAQFRSMKNFILVNEVQVYKYLRCVANKLGIIEGGKLNVERVTQQYRMDLDVDNVRKMVQSCVNISSISDETTNGVVTDAAVHTFYVCLFETDIGRKIRDAAQEAPTKELIN